MLRLDRFAILKRLEGMDLRAPIIEAFVAFSAGRAVMPPPGELIFDEPPGDLHIKYGYLRGGPYTVIKVASGFYENHRRQLPSSQGLMIVLDRETGVPLALLEDEGALTDLRTALAGSVAADWLAPTQVDAIGVIGAGIQARLQVRELQAVRPCRRLVVWNRSVERAERFADEMRAEGYIVAVAASPAAVCSEARLIVTTTPATVPLIHERDVCPGTHITAIGADTPNKTELAPKVLARATLLATDSIAQSSRCGELLHAIDANAIAPERCVELGQLFTSPRPARGQDDVTVAVLTGLAVQDLAIASCVLAAEQPNKEGL